MDQVISMAEAEERAKQLKADEEARRVKHITYQTTELVKAYNEGLVQALTRNQTCFDIELKVPYSFISREVMESIAAVNGHYVTEFESCTNWKRSREPVLERKPDGYVITSTISLTKPVHTEEPVADHL